MLLKRISEASFQRSRGPSVQAQKHNAPERTLENKVNDVDVITGKLRRGGPHENGDRKRKRPPGKVSQRRGPRRENEAATFEGTITARETGEREARGEFHGEGVPGEGVMRMTWPTF
jgi:hypothetical protein